MNRENENNYSTLYYITAGLHVLYMTIFFIEKVSFLAFINLAMVIVYLVLGYQATKTENYKNIFSVCSVAICLFLTSHYIILGPSYGFQYISIGIVSLIFYLVYMHDSSLELSKWLSIALYVVFVIVSLIGARIEYPLVLVSPLSRAIIALINISVAFFIAIKFLSDLIQKIYKDTGILENRNSRLEKAANTDKLTGLQNRRTIDEHMKKAMYMARVERKFFSLLMCDIDDFKKVNDTYGHDCGDEVLKTIANVLKSEVRPDDVIFRWGGEEILILINAGEYVAKNVAERCRNAVERSTVSCNGEDIKVTITIGGVSYFQGVTYEELINRADKNLYEGKHNGKNQVVM